MPVISFCSPKGGAGKTTSALLLATTLASRKAKVIVIDCDPRQWIIKWGEGGNAPETLSMIANPHEHDILDVIDEAASKAPFVIVDLEGTDSTLVAYAISRSNLVVIPAQPGPMEGQSASDAIRLVKRQEKAFGKRIPYAVLMTRMSAAIKTKVESRLLDQMRAAELPIFSTQMIERTAFREIFERNCCLWQLPKGTNQLDRAISNAESFAGEVVSLFKKSNKDKDMVKHE